jgi:hypothetical protein
MKGNISTTLLFFAKKSYSSNVHCILFDSINIAQATKQNKNIEKHWCDKT